MPAYRVEGRETLAELPFFGAERFGQRWSSPSAAVFDALYDDPRWDVSQ